MRRVGLRDLERPGVAHGEAAVVPFQLALKGRRGRALGQDDRLAAVKIDRVAAAVPAVAERGANCSQFQRFRVEGRVLFAVHRAEHADRPVGRDLDVMRRDRKQRLADRAIETHSGQHLLDRLVLADRAVEAPVLGQGLAVGVGMLGKIAGYVDSSVLQRLRNGANGRTIGFRSGLSRRGRGKRQQRPAGENAAPVNRHDCHYCSTRENSDAATLSHCLSTAFPKIRFHITASCPGAKARRETRRRSPRKPGPLEWRAAWPSP